MFFWYFVGAVFLAMLIVVLEEKRLAKGLRDRVRREVINLENKSPVEDYYEPRGWRR